MGWFKQENRKAAAVWPISYCEEDETGLNLLNCDSVQSRDSNAMQ